jgi:hypothetical protein
MLTGIAIINKKEICGERSEDFTVLIANVNMFVDMMPCSLVEGM